MELKVGKLYYWYRENNGPLHCSGNKTVPCGVPFILLAAKVSDFCDLGGRALVNIKLLSSEGEVLEAFNCGFQCFRLGG